MSLKGGPADAAAQVAGSIKPPSLALAVSDRGASDGRRALVVRVPMPDGLAGTAERLRDSWHESGGTVGGRLKRLIDITIAASALVIAAPLMLLIALAIRIRMGQPILFSQDRVGRHGRLFRCYKFRTMVNDADEVLRRHLESHSEAAAEWARDRKLADDPRISALGRLLRKSSLDELPQLYNVLRGDMSCVGPRPIMPDELVRYGAYQSEYLAARPGLSGLWQVSGRSTLPYEQRVALDRLYVRRWSLGLDLWILWRTLPALLRVDDAK